MSLGRSAQLNMRLWNAIFFFFSSLSLISSSFSFTFSRAWVAKLVRRPTHSLLPRFGLSDGTEPVGEGGPRLGDGERAMEVGRSVLSELLDARRTRPVVAVANRPRGSVMEASRGEEGARSIVEEEGSVGLPVERKVETEPSVGELCGLVER